MSSTIIAILSIYLFVGLGFFVKMKFKEKIEERSLVLISIYTLQPILTIWGLTGKEINLNLIYAPFFYLIVVFIALIFSYFIAKFSFSDKKDNSIFLASSLIGNTGNLGIPLAVALYGQESIIYTTLLNLANVFFVHTFGVFFYSRGNYSFKQSMINIIKLPILWFAILGIILNLNEVKFESSINKALEMGAYSSIVLQLIIFGIYLYSTKLKEINYKLLLNVLNVKFILLPLITFVLLQFSSFNEYEKAIIFLQMAMPLAVANVNYASLYECKPIDVTSLVFVSSVIFLGFIFLDILIIKNLL